MLSTVFGNSDRNDLRRLGYAIFLRSNLPVTFLGESEINFSYFPWTNYIFFIFAFSPCVFMNKRGEVNVHEIHTNFAHMLKPSKGGASYTAGSGAARG